MKNHYIYPSFCLVSQNWKSNPFSTSDSVGELVKNEGLKQKQVLRFYFKRDSESAAVLVMGRRK